MKEWIIEKYIGLQAPKWIRHFLAFLGAVLAANGMEGNVEHLGQLIAGAAALVVSVVWSYVAKRPVSPTWKAAIAAFGEAVARQLITVIAGLAAVDPQLLMSGETSTSAFLLILLNIWLSARQAPDGSTGKGKPAIKIPSNR